MSIKLWAKIGVILGSILIGLFLLILLSPFILNFFIDKYTPQIAGEINKATGLSAGLEEVKIIGTPKLTAGLKVKKFELYTPNKEPIFIANNFQVKMSLIPLFAKNIRIDVVSLDNADISLKFNKEGELDLLQYLPEQNMTDNGDISAQKEYLPFGLKLSNHLPDIHIGSYKVTVTDGKDNYIVNGGKTDVTDFIINKSVKVKGSGKITLKGREQFNYNINLFNKIMPDIELNELVFNPPQEEKEQTETGKLDIINILKGLYDYKVTANANVDLKTTKDSIDGGVNISNVSIIGITPSNADLKFKGNSININSNIYTAKNEATKVNGKITTGKKPYIDMNFKSDLEIANVLDIVKKIAQIFNIKDLQTLTANGGVNIDCNFKSDLKTVQSSGYIKIPTAKLYYGLYKVGIDNINAEVSLANNNINIKNVSFSILNQPLRIYGTLTQDAVADIHTIADKLSLKGLLVAAGQAAIMKENPITSGTVSMDAIIKGKLDKINPVIKLDIANIDLKNIPADIRLKAPSTVVNITSDGVTFGGNAKSTNVQLINPALTVSAPIIKANINPDAIEITQTPVTIEKIKTNISGKITNFLTEKIGLDFVSTGDIKSALKGDMNITKQTLNLVYATTDLSEIIIPMFDKSKLSFRGKLNITGSMTNPIISGYASVPSINIPEIPVTMSDMDVKLNGTILHGSATVKEFVSGGIKAENCSSDFEMKGVNFYLNNLKGSAFNGKVNGNIVYNMSNAKTKIDFKGSGMNAEKAVEGAAGIKKALTGTLGFDTNLSLTVLDYNEMIKSMKGSLSFNIKNGAFGSIGRFEGLLNANNLLTNALLKNTIASISNATGLATTAEFEKIEGKMTFSDGWVSFNPIQSAGKSLCYYVTGKFNLINGTTNAVVLGRLDSPMVAKLGVLGQLNASKIIGTTAANVLKILTANPAGEKTELIPALTNGSTNYQDFKVNFNGGIESKSSVKSFKWLSNADMTDVTPQTTKEAVKAVKEAFNTDVKTTVNSVNETIQTKKQEIQDTKEQIKNTADDFKNLWKNIKESAKTTTSTTTKTETKSETVEKTTTTETQPKQTEVKQETVAPTQTTPPQTSTVQEEAKQEEPAQTQTPDTTE